MAFDTIAENKIRQAMQDGEFDNLPGGGKPLDLDGYFKAPEHLRMAYSILKSANCVPEEVEFLNEVDRLERETAAASTDEAKRALAKPLAAARLRLDLALERARRRR